MNPSSARGVDAIKGNAGATPSATENCNRFFRRKKLPFEAYLYLVTYPFFQKFRNDGARLPEHTEQNPTMLSIDQ